MKLSFLKKKKLMKQTAKPKSPVIAIITTKDPKYKGIVEGKTEVELFHMRGLPIHGLKPVPGKQGYQEFIVVKDPVVTRAEYLSRELRERQRDARSLGMPEPIGITDWCESIMPTVEKKVLQVHIAKTEPKVVAPSLPKGPGVIESIVKILTEEASKLKPMTKEKLLRRLSKLFPERDPEKMSSTIRAQLANSGLKSKGVPIKTNGDGGYWIKKS